MTLEGVRVTWSATRNGNEGTVTEHRSDGTESTWTMPAHIVPAFVRGRQRIIEMVLQSAGFRTAKFDEELESAFYELFKGPAP